MTPRRTLSAEPTQRLRPAGLLLKLNPPLYPNAKLNLRDRVLGKIERMGLPGGSDDKESTCNAGALGLIPGWGTSLEEGMATHFRILTWRISMDRGRVPVQEPLSRHLSPGPRSPEAQALLDLSHQFRHPGSAL